MFRKPLQTLPLQLRPLSLEAAHEIQEQQLAVDDADAELMASAKGTVLLLKEAAKLLKAGELPKFRYDEYKERANEDEIDAVLIC